MSSSSEPCRRSAPLIAVVGSTGTGKSELAINIALAHNGEIINGDAMQLYRGLPIITNKIPVGEQKGIPHHLLGEIGLEEPTWTVGDFVRHAQTKIREIRERGRVPILVGGTHYYTQSLLFEDALSGSAMVASEGQDAAASGGEAKQSSEATASSAETDGAVDDGGEKATQDIALTHPILLASPEEILLKLREVDPIMADRWHPNDHRKIRRSLEIYLQTGRPASEIYATQHRASTPPHSDKPAPEPPTFRLRTPTLILWVHATPTSLHPRLDSRVDKMLDRGLLSEVTTLSSFASSSPSSSSSSTTPIDTTRGIYVSIGYKEFAPYATALLSPSTSPSTLSNLLADGIERTKIATRQYAKSQTRWLRTKLLSAVTAADAQSHFFLLDGSDLANWDRHVSATALELVDKFLGEEPLPAPKSLGTLAGEMLEVRGGGDMSVRREVWGRRWCEGCGVCAVTESDWRQHLGSKRHKMAEKRARAVAEGREPGRGRKTAEGQRGRRDVDELKDDGRPALHEDGPQDVMEKQEEEGHSLDEK